MRRLRAFAILFALAGCATVPQKTLGTLDRADPQFSTQECLDGRNLALQFNNKVYTRMGLGLAFGLLGPVGLPLAAAADMDANEQRKLMNAELKRRCATDWDEKRRIEAMRTGAPSTAAPPVQPAPNQVSAPAGKPTPTLRAIGNPGALTPAH